MNKQVTTTLYPHEVNRAYRNHARKLGKVVPGDCPAILHRDGAVTWTFRGPGGEKRMHFLSPDEARSALRNELFSLAHYVPASVWPVRHSDGTITWTFEDPDAWLDQRAEEMVNGFAPQEVLHVAR